MIRLACLSILFCVPASAQTVIKFNVSSSMVTYGYTSAQVREAVQNAFDYFERNANVDLQAVSSGGRYTITTGTLHLGGGRHARGQVIGRTIYLHSGWVPAHTQIHRQAMWFKFFGSEQSIASILAHEIGHAVTFGNAHSRDPSCLMNINANAADLCPSEKARLVARYGPKPEPPAPRPTFPWTNPDNKYDVSGNGRVSSRDALLAINAIGTTVDPYVKPKYFYDVNGDKQVTAADAKSVLNHLRGN